VAKVAVAWLLETDWKRWQELDTQMPDYPRWLSKIDAAMKSVEEAGAEPVKIEVDPDTFVIWCNANGKTVGRESRSYYVAQILMNRLTAH
jgi:hypothetical protein